MGTHYMTCAPIAVLGSFLVVVSQAFAPATLEWVAAGVAMVREPGETLPLSPGSHPYCVGPHANGADARWRG